MKKTMKYFLPLFLAVVFINSCGKDEKEPEYYPLPGTPKPAADVPVSGVKFGAAVYEVSLGHEIALTATVEPANATNKTVFFTSAQPERVSVDGNMVKGLRLYNPEVDSNEGVTITVTTADGGFTSKCEFKVIVVPLTGVSLDVPVVTLAVNEEFEMTAKWTPANASIFNIEWESADEAIATVDENGLIKAVSVGETLVTYTMNGYNKAFAKVIVEPKPGVSGLSINTAQLKLELRKSFTLSLTITPADADVSSIEWVSDNPEIAKITPAAGATPKTCVIDGLTVGKTTVKALIKTPKANLEAKCDVDVNFSPLKDIKFFDADNKEVSDLKVELGKTADVKIVYDPVDVTVYSVTWKSTNTAVVNVPAAPAANTKPESVRLTARTPGKETITVEVKGLDADGKDVTVEKSFTVEVTFVPLNAIEIEYTATGSKTVDLKLILHSGQFGKDKDGKDVEKTPHTTSIVWTSSNEAIATVDKSSGKVTAVSAGTVTMTVTVQGYAENGSPVTKTASCTLTIEKINTF